ncbi:hypothetical protein BD310DRAFT_914542 [Dichomitus squalens]|uniref:Uncharacterized protein n=1 Tax=Dichomitus squalens TaxID=114155 RepID=A0A4Q9QAT5_9APHY|nr:hypothetical protein BD310DRAFT_914542 [Dichomitus squalens]
MLRPRYRLNWELVRLGTQRTRLHCEYGQSPLVGDVAFMPIAESRIMIAFPERTTTMGAMRVADGHIVAALKRVKKFTLPHEAEFNGMFAMPGKH